MQTEKVPFKGREEDLVVHCVKFNRQSKGVRTEDKEFTPAASATRRAVRLEWPALKPDWGVLGGCFVEKQLLHLLHLF